MHMASYPLSFIVIDDSFCYFKLYVWAQYVLCLLLQPRIASLVWLMFQFVYIGHEVQTPCPHLPNHLFLLQPKCSIVLQNSFISVLARIVTSISTPIGIFTHFYPFICSLWLILFLAQLGKKHWCFSLLTLALLCIKNDVCLLWSIKKPKYTYMFHF